LFNLNDKRQINFNPDRITHKKNMSSRDGLMTPTSQMTSIDNVNADHSATINNFRPFYPGLRDSVEPESMTEPTKLVMPQRNATATVTPSSAVRLTEVQNYNASSLMISLDPDSPVQSNEQKKYTEEQFSDESEDDEIIPDDELWKDRKCFWQMNEKIRIRWDLFVMCLAIWNCFSIPFQAAFEPESMDSIFFLLFNACID
jgi:hypothetical protein